ncbi:hypothetical protein HDU99_008839, partial [Rhizoclosmatium hyalinum]
MTAKQIVYSAVSDNQLTGVIPTALVAAIAAKGASISVGTNCLSGSANQRSFCNRKLPDCRSISLDGGYMDSRWTPLWSALAAAQNDMNAFDKAADSLGAAHFGVREYEFQAFRYYAARRAWCMAKHPDFSPLASTRALEDNRMESASDPAPPNKLIPLLLFGLRDPNSHLHKFTRDIDAFRLLITVISRRNFRAWIDRSTKVRSRIRGEFDKGMICFPEEIAFPEPLRNEDGTVQEFHVNMMPFVMVNPDVGLDGSVLYEKHMYTHHKLEEMLPPECKRYAPIIA